MYISVFWTPQQSVNPAVEMHTDPIYKFIPKQITELNLLATLAKIASREPATEKSERERALSKTERGRERERSKRDKEYLPRSTEADLAAGVLGGGGSSAARGFGRGSGGGRARGLWIHRRGGRWGADLRVVGWSVASGTIFGGAASSEEVGRRGAAGRRTEADGEQQAVAGGERGEEGEKGGGVGGREGVGALLRGGGGRDRKRGGERGCRRLQWEKRGWERKRMKQKKERPMGAAVTVDREKREGEING